VGKIFFTNGCTGKKERGTDGRKNFEKEAGGGRGIIHMRK